MRMDERRFLKRRTGRLIYEAIKDYLPLIQDGSMQDSFDRICRNHLSTDINLDDDFRVFYDIFCHDDADELVIEVFGDDDAAQSAQTENKVDRITEAIDATFGKSVLENSFYASKVTLKQIENNNKNGLYGLKVTYTIVAANE